MSHVRLVSPYTTIPSKMNLNLIRTVVLVIITGSALFPMALGGKHPCPANELNFKYDGVDVTELVKARNWVDITETRLWKLDSYMDPLNKTVCWGVCPLMKRVLEIVMDWPAYQGKQSPLTLKQQTQRRLS